MNSSTLIKTKHASKYLQQLCKHFAHKVEVDYDAEKGLVQFPPGPCTILASGDDLRFSCTSEQEQGLQVMHSIIEQHLVKFAWREELTFLWDIKDQPVLSENNKDD